MASIQTAIQLADRVSGPMLQILTSVNRTIIAFEEMQQASASPVDTGWVDGTRQDINEATASVMLLQEEIEKVANGRTAPVIEPKISMPEPLPYPATGPSYNIPENLPAPKIPQPDPVRVPVVWETSGNLEVFTNSGVERFQQEIQAALASLDSMTASQSNVIRMAQRMEIPPGMMNDLVGMNARIQTIQTTITQLEANPIDDIGADAVNNQLEQLRGQLVQATSAQNQLTEAMGRMDITAANTAYNQLNSVVSQAERSIRDNTDAQKEFNQEVGKGTDAANGLLRTIARYAAAFAGVAGVKGTLDLSDTLTSTTARLNLMNDGLQTTEDLQNMIYLSAQNSRGAYQETADMVARLGMMAGDAFGSNAETIAFAEQLNKQFAIAGTDATGISAAMLQLTQAMGSGVLRGEEFNSILEQAPNIIQTIADYMGVPKGELKDMASEGKLTADIVKNALFAATDETNAKFESMPMTFSQVGNNIKNQALKAFEPVLQRIGEITQSADFQTMTTGITNALVVVSGVALDIFEMIGQAGSWIKENWSIIQPFVIAAAVVMGLYTAAVIANSVVQGVSALSERIHAAAVDRAKGVTMKATAAQYGLNAALLASPVTWILLIIIAIIAAIYAVVAVINKVTGQTISATGIICGALMVALAFIGNIFIALWNVVVDVFVLIYNIVAKVANFVGNAFQDPVGAVCRLFFDLVDTVLGVLQTVASAIDTIFGTNLAGSVQGWRDSLGGWVDDTFGKGVEVMAELDADSMKLGRFEYGAAWDTGYAFGEGLEDTIGNFNPADLFENNLPDPGDYEGMYSDISGIGSDVGDMKDAAEISKEDLKYLRDIADRESINRFTTAEIKVDMQNTNQIGSTMDIDGVINHFGEQMEEALSSVVLTAARG